MYYPGIIIILWWAWLEVKHFILPIVKEYLHHHWMFVIKNGSTSELEQGVSIGMYITCTLFYTAISTQFYNLYWFF